MGGAPPSVRVAALGLAHLHAFAMAALLREAGAELVAFHAGGGDAALAAAFARQHPDARACKDAREILDDDSIALVLCADVPDRRAALGVACLERGKHLFVDKPAAVTLDQLAALEAARRASGRLCAIYFSERLTSRATRRALALVQAGAIGEVVETIGLGPHRVGSGRPDWFWEPARSGGILGDLASHQMDQFLAFTGERTARVVAARVENRAHPERVGFQDYGHALVRGERAHGYARVDWYTPDGLGSWGDVRLFVLGSAGTIELRKNVDPAGRPGGDHLILVDAKETRHVDCSRDPLAAGRELLADVAEGTDRALPHAHAFLAQRLALEAQLLGDGG